MDPEDGQVMRALGTLLVMLALYSADPSPAVAQEHDHAVVFSPYAFKAWGQTNHAAMVGYSLGSWSIYYFMAREREGVLYRGEPAVFTESFAVSYALFQRRWARVEVLASPHRIPIKAASRVNIKLDIGIPIKRVQVFYTHLSNGFGILNPNNPGVDFFTVRVNL